ncbi:MAG: hypothetical protein H7232_11125 [Aeromicrobium sp.]|nr:hypothetical protein [Burkholderiales bacterium]
MPDEITLAVGQVWVPAKSREVARKITGLIRDVWVDWSENGRAYPIEWTSCRTHAPHFRAWIKRTDAKLEVSK